MAFNLCARQCLRGFSRNLTNSTTKMITPALSMAPTTMPMTSNYYHCHILSPTLRDSLRNNRKYAPKLKIQTLSTSPPSNQNAEESSLSKEERASAGQLAANDEVSSTEADSPADAIRSRVDDVVASLPLTERLFAVVQIDYKQYRVSQDDIVTTEDW